MKTTEQLYSTMGLWGCYTNPLAGETRVRIFRENGAEIPLGVWEDVVHAGMVVVIEFIPTMTDRRWSEPSCLGMFQLTALYICVAQADSFQMVCPTHLIEIHQPGLGRQFRIQHPLVQ